MVSKLDALCDLLKVSEIVGEAEFLSESTSTISSV